jgi:hypothetical protein
MTIFAALAASVGIRCCEVCARLTRADHPATYR